MVANPTIESTPAMRILYLDIDALRPDHLGCYGYHRNTSPNIDALSKESALFENCYASDTPCCPSRTSLFTGRFGIHNGVVCHAGQRAEPYSDSADRDFQDILGRTSWMRTLRDVGYRTASVSSFGERHSAWWWYANFNDILNTGQDGMEDAAEITPVALDWLDRCGQDEDWFLHVNYWDVHTPYRVPEDFGDPFANSPLPGWYSEAIRKMHWQGAGPQCARERGGMDGHDDHEGRYPRQPYVIDSIQQARRVFDGYDTAIRYVDDHIGRLLKKLKNLGILDSTAVIVSADHGETLGELNIYGCHQAADHVTTRIPMIVRWPGVTDDGWVDERLHYHVDVAATVTSLSGGGVPKNWDGVAFELQPSVRNKAVRDELVLSHMQGTCQRAVRFIYDGRDFHCVFTEHDGLHYFPDVMLFDIAADPHELNDIAPQMPSVVANAKRRLEAWLTANLVPGRPDPMQTVLDEGGPPHSRGWLPRYAERLRESDRGEIADALLERYGHG